MGAFQPHLAQSQAISSVLSVWTRVEHITNMKWELHSQECNTEI